MMQLLIQGLRAEYEALDRVLNEGFERSSLSAEDVENAYSALDSILEKLILSSSSYHGMTSGLEISHNLALDMQYVLGHLSEPEMRQREEWHWHRCEEQEWMENEKTNQQQNKE